MPTKKENTGKNKGGRPPIQIDLEDVEELAGIGCTQKEIAEYFEISLTQIRRKEGFLQAYKKGFVTMARSLRRQQYVSAKSGNPIMQIFLGKQLLGQSDICPEQRAVWAAQKKNIEAQTRNIETQNEINKEKLRLLKSAEETTLDKLDQILDSLLTKAIEEQGVEGEDKLNDVKKDDGDS